MARKQDKEYSKVVAERFDLARRMSGLSISDAAKKIGLSRQSIYYYESGERLPTIDVVYRACRAYGCSAGWLVGTEDSLSVRPSRQLY